MYILIYTNRKMRLLVILKGQPITQFNKFNTICSFHDFMIWKFLKFHHIRPKKAKTKRAFLGRFRLSEGYTYLR